METKEIKIFLVDDDAFFLELLKIEVQQHGNYTIETFETGEACIRNLSQNPDVIFLIIGDGDRRKWLETDIRKRKLKNCKLLPLQAVDKIPYSFASADLAIVSLGTMASGLSLPSKTFNFMSAGLPLL